MDQDWIEIYRSYSADELASEITRLKKAISDADGINSASSGSKTYQRDLLHLKNRLQAAVRVSGQVGASGRSPRDAGLWGVPDFSGAKV